MSTNIISNFQVPTPTFLFQQLASLTKERKGLLSPSSLEMVLFFRGPNRFSFLVPLDLRAFQRIWWLPKIQYQISPSKTASPIHSLFFLPSFKLISKACRGYNLTTYIHRMYVMQSRSNKGQKLHQDQSTNSDTFLPSIQSGEIEGFGFHLEKNLQATWTVGLMEASQSKLTRSSNISHNISLWSLFVTPPCKLFIEPQRHRRGIDFNQSISRDGH